MSEQHWSRMSLRGRVQAMQAEIRDVRDDRPRPDADRVTLLEQTLDELEAELDGLLEVR